jgi:stage II sporulation protein D
MWTMISVVLVVMLVASLAMPENPAISRKSFHRRGINVGTTAFLLFAYCFCSALSCLALPAQVKVALFDAQTPPQRLLLWGPCQVEGDRSFAIPAGRYFLNADHSGEVCLRSDGAHSQLLVRGRSFNLRAFQNGRLRIEEPPARLVGSQLSGASLHARHYKGTIVVSATSIQSSKFALKFVNIVSRREYLASVVASEMPVGAPLEALKAQSVLANTQIAKFSNRQIIEDSTQIQSYRGSPDSRPEAYVAAEQTFNRTLEFEHKPIQAFFHSTCGGMTSKPADIFGGHERLPYLTNVKCNYCSQSPFWRETIACIPEPTFETTFGIKIPVIVSRDVAGRPTEIKYQFAGRSVTSNGYQYWLTLGQSLGWDKAPGTRYSFSERDRKVFIKSNGAGHGVGMCQYGAIGMARRGKTYEEILAFYFPGAQLSVSRAPRVQALSAR